MPPIVATVRRNLQNLAYVWYDDGDNHLSVAKHNVSFCWKVLSA